jgi:hypothetical protein
MEYGVKIVAAEKERRGVGTNPKKGRAALELASIKRALEACTLYKFLWLFLWECM